MSCEYINAGDYACEIPLYEPRIAAHVLWANRWFGTDAPEWRALCHLLHLAMQLPQLHQRLTTWTLVAHPSSSCPVDETQCAWILGLANIPLPQFQIVRYVKIQKAPLNKISSQSSGPQLSKQLPKQHWWWFLSFFGSCQVRLRELFASALHTESLIPLSLLLPHFL